MAVARHTLGMKRVVAACVVSWSLLAATPARAEERASLQYTGNAECPGDATLRARVAARLGRDPFDAASKKHVRVTVRRREERGYQGTVAVVEADGVARAERSFTAEACDELVSTVALSISVILDPASLFSPAPPPETVEPPRADPPRAPQAVEADTPAPNAPAAPRGQFSAGIGASFGQGDAPAPVLGGVLYGAYRRGAFGAVLETHASFEGSAPTERGRVSSWSLGGLTGPCMHVAPFFGCALAGVSAIFARADVARPRDDDALVGMAGARLGGVMPLGSRLELRLQTDALAFFTQHRLAIGGGEVYEYAPGRLGAAALVGGRF